MLAGLQEADALYNRGNALARLGRLEEAALSYRAALRLAPTDEDIRHNLALVVPPPPEPPENRDDTEPEPPPSNGQGEPDQQAGTGEDESQQRPSQGERDTAGTPTDRPPDSAQRETERLAERWLDQADANPAGLLRARLAAEHRRREAGLAPRPWEGVR